MATAMVTSEPTETIDEDSIEAKLDADTLSELRSAHPRARYFLIDETGQPVVFRPLKGAEFDRLKRMLEDPKRKHGGPERAAKDVIVYPKTKELDALFEDFPGLPMKVTTLAVEVARGEEPEEVKKLASSSTERKRAT
jgi:hypothetical protein